jgi:hypothetical protein
MKRYLALPLFCVGLAGPAMAQAPSEPACAPVRLSASADPAQGDRIADYRPVLERCVGPAAEDRLGTRRMSVDGEALLLTVDPRSLETRLERAACLRCVETSAEDVAETRFFRALRAAPEAARPPALINAGLIHGNGAGVYVTGDLCPTARPLDRAFIEEIAAHAPGAPLTLAISGAWLAHHAADFGWLKEKEASGAVRITWANHSYSHPYVVGLADRRNYLLRPGVDFDREVFETEKLLIVNGGTPSVFFRFPGLVADPALLAKLRGLNLIPLGADAWLALGAAPRDGSIVLVHPNGNEPLGLKLFSRYLASGRLPQPFRAINEAP